MIAKTEMTDNTAKLIANVRHVRDRFIRDWLDMRGDSAFYQDPYGSLDEVVVGITRAIPHLEQQLATAYDMPASIANELTKGLCNVFAVEGMAIALNITAEGMLSVLDG